MRWLKDKDYYVEQRADEAGKQQLFRVHARTGEAIPLYNTGRILRAFLEEVPEVEGRALVTDGAFAMSPDESAVMITHEGSLYYYHFKHDIGRKLTAAGEGSDATVQVPCFSPDGTMISFVRGNDLFVVDVHSARQTRLTATGTFNLFNGMLDWVYQEEVFGRGNYRSHWWSPDSRHIAFLELDESPVPSFTVVDHIPQHLTTEVSNTKRLLVYSSTHCRIPTHTPGTKPLTPTAHR